MSHPFKLPGMALFDSLREMLETVINLREKDDHIVLESLEECLRNSTEHVSGLAENISQAEVWIRDITNILLGTPDKKGNRNTDEYKCQTTAEKTKGQLHEYILNLIKTRKQYSKFLQEVIAHFRATHNNWNEHLFTCYDHWFLPNTNLELELSHSRMKRKHRKITGLKNSHQFILIHGEHFSFCSDFSHGAESLAAVLRSSDPEKIRSKSREELEKSRQRGENRLSVKNLPDRLKKISAQWAIS